MPTKLTLDTRNERKQKRKPKSFKAKVFKCKHTQGWIFEQLEDGTRRSCKAGCGFSVKLIGR